MLTYEQVWDSSNEGLEWDETFLGGWLFKETYQDGTWRWGYFRHTVLQRKVDGRYFRFTIKVFSGDHGPSGGHWEWGDEIDEWEEVRPIPTATTTWEGVECEMKRGQAADVELPSIVEAHLLARIKRLRGGLLSIRKNGGDFAVRIADGVLDADEADDDRVKNQTEKQ